MIRKFTPLLGRDCFLRQGTSDLTIWENTFERNQHIPPDAMPTPSTVLDLGANIGVTAAAYQHMWPEAEVIAVEMDADNARVAKMNFAGPVIVGAVVYCARERVTYDRSVYPASYTLGSGDTEATQVPFHDLLHDYFDAPVDFCKMDIEGAEDEILENAGEWSEMVSNLLIECHEQVHGYSIEDAIKDLLEAGYQISVISRGRQALYAWT